MIWLTICISNNTDDLDGNKTSSRPMQTTYFFHLEFFYYFSDDLSFVLSIILTLGNFMNGGTNRGQADGFQLSVLNKIRDVKTQVGKDCENRCTINVT